MVKFTHILRKTRSEKKKKHKLDWKQTRTSCYTLHVKVRKSRVEDVFICSKSIKGKQKEEEKSTKI